MKEALPIIGLHNPISLNKQKISRLLSKADTGAYNCSIDCCFTEESRNESGEKILYYILLNKQHSLYTGEKYKTKKFRKKEVRSSNGTITARYQVKLKLELHGKLYRTTFNLGDRSKMRYSVLLGRKFLSGRFLIDVSKDRNSKSE